MIIVSACLAGVNCRYDGGCSCKKNIMEMVARGEAIPVCPEQLGGLHTPRPAAEIVGGTGMDVIDGRAKVIREDGRDLTAEFIRGANEVLKIALMAGAGKAILKARSPSCGSGEIYDGTFSGKLIEGNGVTAELLKRNGINVVADEDV